MKTLLISLLIVIALAGGAFYEAKRILNDHVIRNLAAEQLKVQDYSLTVPEGKRREEVALLAEHLGICSAADFMTASVGKEGYLFPDTYRFYKNTPASQVVSTMTDDFAKRTSTLKPTPDQVVLASIVEREALSDADRPMIASIYQHRLDVGMKLQADPTVEYAKDTLSQGSGLLTAYWKPITEGEYQSVKSPFNTYLIAALPEAAIANPGLKSLDAAANTARTDQLYFLYKNKKLLTSKTLEQHLSQE